MISLQFSNFSDLKLWQSLYYARSWHRAQAGLSQTEAMVRFPSLQLKLSLIWDSQRAAVFLPEIQHSNEEVCLHVSVKVHIKPLQVESLHY